MKDRLCISVKTAVKLFLKGNTTLIDIRDSHSFKLSHIYGSINISMYSLNDFFKLKNFLVPIMIICYHGIDSKYIAFNLKNKGYKKVYSIDGGFKEWSNIFPQLVYY